MLILPRIFLCWYIYFFIFFAAVLIASEETPKDFPLTLLQEKKFNEAAIEARKMALAATSGVEQAAFYFLAAYAYSATQDFARANKMLDKAEDVYPDIKENALFLRGKIAMEQARYNEALFFFEALLPEITNKNMREFVWQEIATAHFMQGNTNATITAINELDDTRQAKLLKTVENSYNKPDKSPILGGFLGLVPGLGYAYSEEYANAARCLILNGIFISAMVYSASEEQWGAFAVISFFELTWYSGSIYGGIDAAHRYNREKKAKVAATIRAGATLDGVDFSTFPKISLQIRF